MARPYYYDKPQPPAPYSTTPQLQVLVPGSSRSPRYSTDTNSSTTSYGSLYSTYSGAPTVTATTSPPRSSAYSKYASPARSNTLGLYASSNAPPIVNPAPPNFTTFQIPARQVQVEQPVTRSNTLFRRRSQSTSNTSPRTDSSSIARSSTTTRGRQKTKTSIFSTPPTSYQPIYNGATLARGESIKRYSSLPPRELAPVPDNREMTYSSGSVGSQFSAGRLLEEPNLPYPQQDFNAAPTKKKKAWRNSWGFSSKG